MAKTKWLLILLGLMIESLIEKAENNVHGETLIVKGNTLKTRYDELSGQAWIDVTSDDSTAMLTNCTK